MKVYYDDETIKGYSDDIIKDFKRLMTKAIKDEDFDTLSTISDVLDLMHDLKGYGHTKVTCSYHPMGAWVIKEEEK